MPIARLALASEESAVIALGRQCCEEHSPHAPFDEALARKTFHAYMTTANPTILVVEDYDRDHALIGLAVAWFAYSGFSKAHMINLDVAYTRADKRDGPAAALLAEAFDVFASRTEPSEIVATTLQGIDSADVNVALLKRGYEAAGTILRRIPSVQ